MENQGSKIDDQHSTINNQPSFFVHESSYVDTPVTIGAGTKIWHFCHVLPECEIGAGCSFGQNCVIGPRVKIGNNVKVQNNISIYEGVEIEDDVFLGPSCVLTNVTNPRSQVLRKSLYEKTLLKRGCSIGANATIVCGITIGRYAFIGAGAVVHSDVPDYALMLGVPAKQKGWMSRHGHFLKNPDSEGVMICPESKLHYEVRDGVLSCLDQGENDSLPSELAIGHEFYDDFKDK
ncbi:UDP-2-acetamido-3-amino-2,3-dideoxy-glucuronate N-acetyltransferase [Desulfuromusa kysingii]|uniref:UDP-2-acetamido-3-amino-2,3-dideoxy-glucuronate N-acetyltransferase n=1 Tax=Desulfuromusa kysingii TaxID=37625 RepID=A0A1H3YGV1_9BACT|nr:acyltransferase [Desulfuromusa kysingii]SEA10839.1 UDP-2-acetamido-3-amino-2,3-dideoxy-glucuronate N-acetyltransferase [Desulfuromusa kysingii]